MQGVVGWHGSDPSRAAFLLGCFQTETPRRTVPSYFWLCLWGNTGSQTGAEWNTACLKMHGLTEGQDELWEMCWCTLSKSDCASVCRWARHPGQAPSAAAPHPGLAGGLLGRGGCSLAVHSSVFDKYPNRTRSWHTTTTGVGHSAHYEICVNLWTLTKMKLLKFHGLFFPLKKNSCYSPFF